MGKKGKGKKSGGGKKKKSSKKKKTSEAQMSWQEALLAYQINIKEKSMEDYQYELRALEEKNKRHKERNERLKQEQLFYIDNLLKQAKEFEKQLEEAEVVTKEEVVEVMKDKWANARKEEDNLQEIKKQIDEKANEILSEEKQVEYWTEYKEKGQHEHSKQIKLLEHELVDMQTSFDEMAKHLERTLSVAKEEIHRHTTDTLDNQKFIASEKAMARMDKYSRQEVLDNDWLKREVEIHQKEADDMMKIVEKLEKENLGVMSELFECTVDDLKISRNFFLTQFADHENLEETGILEIDLNKVSLHDRKPGSGDSSKRAARPQSATQKAIHDKVFSLPVAPPGEEDESEESDYDGHDVEDSDDEDPFNNYFHFDDEDFDDYLKLGPLELKLLNVQGTKMEIYKPKTPSKEEMRAQLFKPDHWPVTSNMLQTIKSDR